MSEEIKEYLTEMFFHLWLWILYEKEGDYLLEHPESEYWIKWNILGG